MDKNFSNPKPQILLTNDDGIASPGLWAAAQTLSKIGFVHVVAPREQSSAAGRSLPSSSDGLIQAYEKQIDGQNWKTYAVGGTPAQAVLHAILEVLPVHPDLCVSGINYGENIGTGVTVSGTVGAAMEAASLGIPALAVSLETEQQHHYSHSDAVDFSTAAYFTALFGRMLIEKNLPEDIDLLKVEIPSQATLETPWMITRLSRQRYFEPTTPQRASWNEPGQVGYRLRSDHSQDQPDSDAYALSVLRCVSVTPLSLDMTSRVDLVELEQKLRGQD